MASGTQDKYVGSLGTFETQLVKEFSDGTYAERVGATLLDGAGNEIATLPTVDRRTEVASFAHATITGLWGRYPPLPSDASWAANPGGYSKIRFYVDARIRGCTALADMPQVTFRPYVRTGGASGYVGMAASTSLVRPRLIDLPSIKCQKTVDDGANYTDYSAVVIDNNVATVAVLNSLDTVANGDWAIFGGPVPFLGVAIDMTTNVNTTAATVTMEYWNGTAWAALTSVTDGTIVTATKTLSGDGQISWAIPADWAASTINAIAAYWVRLSVSTALSAAVEIAELDVVMPLRAAIDVDADGGDAMLVLESQDVTVTGTLAYAGTIRGTWR